LVLTELFFGFFTAGSNQWLENVCELANFPKKNREAISLYKPLIFIEYPRRKIQKKKQSENGCEHSPDGVRGLAERTTNMYLL
jgi:hypothetical protein